VWVLQVWATAVVLALLESRFSTYRDEWVAAARKARR
jgi:hypothetical protein